MAHTLPQLVRPQKRVPAICTCKRNETELQSIAPVRIAGVLTAAGRNKGQSRKSTASRHKAGHPWERGIRT
ncbi:hypothetical protein GCM10019060_02800 [Novosphingobium pokkalii]|nr:hypothetical protein GCM10019060_02800 [Novosphingobium pokkalii]